MPDVCKMYSFNVRFHNEPDPLLPPVGIQIGKEMVQNTALYFWCILVFMGSRHVRESQ
jgi:hypothetical protein